MTQTTTETKTHPRPLDGCRIVDFTWVRAGPWATRWLGALGAQVIKIEWPLREFGRAGGAAGAPPGITPTLNTGGGFNDTNANKMSLSLNVRSPRGMDIIRRLIAVSDAVVENYSASVLENWGLGYDELRKLREDIVYVSMSGFGHSGRDKHYTTFGPSAQALSGMTFASGLPDKPPAGWGWSYLDDSGGMYIAFYTLSRPVPQADHWPRPARGHGPDDHGRNPQRPGAAGRHHQRPQLGAGGLPAGKPRELARHPARKRIPRPHRRASQQLSDAGRRLQRLVHHRLLLGRGVVQPGVSHGQP